MTLKFKVSIFVNLSFINFKTRRLLRICYTNSRNDRLCKFCSLLSLRAFTESEAIYELLNSLSLRENEVFEAIQKNVEQNST
ncbi:hypothetical protein [Campylobacter sp. VBCF_01 NA2]|uniref:hypothetical protein n=1 Tax=Campylobacter sp. VBCF_01 NA2 TaxID=2983836 RepID=UPI0022EA0666|nr:hypothetical protein [Campylobacter sp. VBCF_01 NA2]WBR53559.1 hypothetical protein PF027_04295 [Campylobacter sp. VBCF_01 NA2]